VKIVDARAFERDKSDAIEGPNSRARRIIADTVNRELKRSVSGPLDEARHDTVGQTAFFPPTDVAASTPPRSKAAFFACASFGNLEHGEHTSMLRLAKVDDDLLRIEAGHQLGPKRPRCRFAF
jgi:hypothetical protein